MYMYLNVNSLFCDIYPGVCILSLTLQNSQHVCLFCVTSDPKYLEKLDWFRRLMKPQKLHEVNHYSCFWSLDITHFSSTFSQFLNFFEFFDWMCALWKQVYWCAWWVLSSAVIILSRAPFFVPGTKGGDVYLLCYNSHEYPTWFTQYYIKKLTKTTLEQNLFQSFSMQSTTCSL